jgi:5-hydroxyisourate hydrolase-like protein (transthyretin family)
MMRISVIVLTFVFIFGLAEALVVGPAVIEQKDMGSSSLPTLIYSLSVDCNASSITAIVTDGTTNQPVQGVDTYLSYVDFTTQLLTHEVTDHDGYIVDKLPGQTALMQGMFILDLQKYGYQSKEVHFDLYPCLHNGQLPPLPTQPVTQNASGSNTSINYTITSTIIDNPIGIDNSSISAVIINQTNSSAQKPIMPDGNPSSPVCPSRGIIILFLAAATLFAKKA